MDAAQRSKLLKMAEGKSDGSASIELTADELFALVNDCMYPPTGPMMAGPGGRYSSSKALSALEGLKKLGYDDRDVASLKKYFDHCVQAEELKHEASIALQRMRDEFYMDKDRKSGGMKNAAKAY
jgi:hypothetical protein